MDKRYLVNESFDNSLNNFIQNKKDNVDHDSIDKYHNIIKSLVFIYGDIDLINPNITKDTRALFDNLTKYGFSKEKTEQFFVYFDNYDLYNIIKNLIEMFGCKKKVLNLSEIDQNDFWEILNEIIKLEENDELKNYFENTLNQKSEVETFINGNILDKLNNLEEIEILEIEEKKTKKQKKEMLSFQLDAVNGYISIMAILIFIAVVCIGVIVINVIVG